MARSRIAASRILTLAFALATFAGPHVAPCPAGEIGPDGTAKGRCNLGVTTASQRRAELFNDLLAPGGLVLISLVVGGGALLGFTRQTASTSRLRGKRILGAITGVMLALGVVSFLLCLTILASHYR